MRLIDRYFLREILGPLGLGFLVYNFILLFQALFKSAELIISRGLPVSTVGELLLLSLPNIVVLTIPMSLLFGVLIAVGRLSADSELVAIRAAGVSLQSLYRPILYLSLVLAVLNCLLMVYLLPWGNHQLQLKRLDILTQSVSSEVQPRIFHEDFEDQVLYVFERPEGDSRWKGVFLSESVPSTQENMVTVAEWGEVRVDEDGERVVLALENAVVHEVDLSQPGRYNISRHRQLEVVLEDQFMTNQRAAISASKSVRELTVPELFDAGSDPSLGAEFRNLARVEIHKKFSIPFASVVFGIFALPLGFNNRRGGKASGFALSILVIIVYWVLLSTGEESARVGDIPPWLAMWGPNVLLSSLGLFLLARRNRDKSLLVTRIDRWIRQDLWDRLQSVDSWRRQRKAVRRTRQRPPRESAHRFVIRLPRLQLRFPNTLDRYVARTFLQVFGLVLLSGLVLYIVGDLVDKADDLLDNQVDRSVVWDYYKYLSLQIFYEISPIIILITTLITFSILSKSNEVTAVKSLGVSLYRIAVPAVVVTLLLTLLIGFLQADVLPAANQRVSALKDQIKGRDTVRTYRRADRQWLFSQDRYIYNYLHYDGDRRMLQRLQVFEFDDQHDLAGRLMADQATYREDGQWVFRDGWSRRFEGISVSGFRTFEGPRLVEYPEEPAFFDSVILPPEQMSYRQLDDYIEELEASGQSVTGLEVELYNKIAYPAICVVMCLLALPFSFRFGRQGALHGVGLSLVLGMISLTIYIFFSQMGQAGFLPPAVAVWSPGAIFTLWAVYMFLGIRT